MKKRSSIILLICVMLTLFALPISVHAATPKLNKSKVTITAGKTVQLKLKNNKKAVKWSSSNKKVATVSNKGLVKAIKQGTCKITAKVGKKKYVCNVTVKAAKGNTEPTDDNNNSNDNNNNNDLGGDANVRDKYFKAVTLTTANINDYLETEITCDDTGSYAVRLKDKMFAKGMYARFWDSYFEIKIQFTVLGETGTHVLYKKLVEPNKVNYALAFENPYEITNAKIISASGTLNYIEKTGVKEYIENGHQTASVIMIDGSKWALLNDGFTPYYVMERVEEP